MDEIGEIPTRLQVKLLRVLHESKFERVGGTHTVKVDARLPGDHQSKLGALSS